MYITNMFIDLKKSSKHYYIYIRGPCGHCEWPFVACILYEDSFGLLRHRWLSLIELDSRVLTTCSYMYYTFFAHLTDKG